METLKRLYERYQFSASALISIPQAQQIEARVSNISYGGCRLLANHRLPVAAEITIKIHALDDEFESLAKVVHSSDTDAGVMFGKMTPGALFVLQRWIAEARYLESMSTS